MDIQNLISNAKKVLGISNEGYNAYFSPGRVNLIGEHIDYNGGHVLPCPLDLGTYGIASIRKDTTVVCYSENFPDAAIISFSLSSLLFDPKDHWVNYVKGIVKEMDIRSGFNLYVKGDIPTGSGLSSSASLEILVAFIINDLFKLELDSIELVKIAHRAENRFIGVNCGIMDQFVIGMAKNHQGILLNTATLEYSSVDIDFRDKVLIIGNTNKPRKLSDSKYNERRAECNAALAILQKKLNIIQLCDLTYSELLKYRSAINDELLLRRVTHVVRENERTQEAYYALKNKEFSLFGRLLNESHKSLKENYQVTGFELDTIVDLFIRFGAVGSRMTGAGFGGCAIALLPSENKEEIIVQVEKEYKNTTGLNPSFYTARIGSGVRKL